MVKIVWLNGAFGAGKTSVAQELQRRLNAFDELFPHELPETVVLITDKMTVTEIADEVEKLL